MELYAGEAWVSRCMRTGHKATASLDINFGKNPEFMSPEWKTDPWDMLTDSGFGFPS